MNKRNMITIIVNFIIALNVFVIAMQGIISGAGEGQLGNYIIGLGYFKPYTMDSNILTGITAFMLVIYRISNRKGNNKQIPRWLMNMYLMGTTCLVLTFVVAAAFLAPAEVISGKNYWIIFSGDMFFFHFLNPLLSVGTLIMLITDYRFSKMDRFVGMIPTILYSLVYFVMVVVLKLWDDFYNFTFGGKYYLIPIVIVVIYMAAYIISYLLVRIHNRYASNTSQCS